MPRPLNSLQLRLRTLIRAALVLPPVIGALCGAFGETVQLFMIMFALEIVVSRLSSILSAI